MMASFSVTSASLISRARRAASSLSGVHEVGVLHPHGQLQPHRGLVVLDAFQQALAALLPLGHQHEAGLGLHILGEDHARAQLLQGDAPHRFLAPVEGGHLGVDLEDLGVVMLDVGMQIVLHHARRRPTRLQILHPHGQLENPCPQRDIRPGHLVLRETAAVEVLVAVVEDLQHRLQPGDIAQDLAGHLGQLGHHAAFQVGQLGAPVPAGRGVLGQGDAADLREHGRHLHLPGIGDFQLRRQDRGQMGDAGAATEGRRVGHGQDLGHGVDAAGEGLFQ